MTQRLLNFDKNNATYLLLNIMAHDVIHDFGPSSDADRWAKSKSFVQQFSNIATFSMPSHGGAHSDRDSYNNDTLHRDGDRGRSRYGDRGRSRDRDRDRDRSRSRDRIPQKMSSFQKTHLINTNNSINNFKLSIKKLVSQINTNILFTFFTKYMKYIYNVQQLSQENSKIILAWENLIMPDLTNYRNPDLADKDLQVRIDIANKFIGYLYNTNLTQDNKNMVLTTIFVTRLAYETYLTNLTNFLNSSVVEETIYENIFGNTQADGVGADMPVRVEDVVEADMIQYEQPQQQYQPPQYQMNFQQQPIEQLWEQQPVHAINTGPGLMSFGGSKSMLKGGAPDPPLTYEQCQELIAAINAGLHDADIIDNFDRMQELYDFHYDPLNADDAQNIVRLNEYSELQNNIIIHFKNIFTNPPDTVALVPVPMWLAQQKKANAINAFTAFPILLTKIRAGGQRTENVKNFFNNIIQNALLTYITIIAKKDAEDAAAAAHIAAIAEAALTGDLSSDDTAVRADFVNFMARSGLYVNGICNNTGKVIYNITGAGNVSPPPTATELSSEINILLAMADWRGVAGNNWGHQYTTKSLDDNLIEHFKANTSIYANNGVVIQKNEHYSPNGFNYKTCSPDKFIVNNAAIGLASTYTSKIFCPYSSILDGMKKCTWTTSNGDREFGNMDFKIQQNTGSIYYNGLLSLTPVAAGHFPVEAELKLIIKPNIINEINITLQNIDVTINTNVLTAWIVMRNTLITYINFILTILTDAQRSTIFTGGNMFSNLFAMFTHNDTSLNDINIFFTTIVYNDILFKGAGDIFQEINCVCRYGGYNGNYYNANNGIARYSFAGADGGNQVRFFVATDRPSGTRFAFINRHGLIGEINIKAFGGYYHILKNGEEKHFLVARIRNPCITGYDPTIVLGTGIGNVARGLKSHKKNKLKRRRTYKRGKEEQFLPTPTKTHKRRYRKTPLERLRAKLQPKTTRRRRTRA